MLEWILIITFTSPYGLAATTVPNFPTEQSCEDAKKVLIKNPPIGIISNARATCIPRGKQS